MAELRKIEFLNFSGGLNTQDASHEILPIQSPDFLNVDISQKGKFFTRSGFAKLNTSIITSATGIYGATYALSKHIACALTTVLAKNNGGYGTTIQSGLTNNTHTYFAEFEDAAGTAYLMGVNGVNAAWKSTGSGSASVITTPPTQWATNPPSFIAAHEGKMWSYTASTNLLCWSDDGTLDVWTTADNGGYESSAFNPKDGYTGTGIVSQKGGLVIFKQNSIYKSSGLTSQSFSFSSLYDKIGCVAPRSIVNIGGKIFFLAQNKNDYGVYCLDDSGGLHWMSEQITPTLNTITVTSASLAAAGHYQNKYILTIPITGGYKTLRLNYGTGSWEVSTGNSMACYYNDSNGLLYGGSTSTGYVYTMDTGTNDDNVAISNYAISRNEPFDGIEYNKILKELWIWAKAYGNYSLTINFYIDDQLLPGTYTVNLGTKGSKRATVVERIPLNLNTQGSQIKIKITGSTTIDQPMEVYKGILYYEVMQPQTR